MKFILNFIFFGVLFYAIYLAFPEVFFTMAGWADKMYHFLSNIILTLSGKLQETKGSVLTYSRQALLLLFFDK